jgi:hypothetical protein
MTELIAFAAICISEGGIASSHMAYTTQKVHSATWGSVTGYPWVEKGPKMLPFYARKIPIWGDVWHLIAGFRYVAFTALAWMAFGWQWKWYVANAITCSLIWAVLKVAHGKHTKWGLAPRWLKQLRERWASISS